MEQGREVKDHEQVEAWEAPKVVVAVGEAVLRQARAVFASALTVVKEHPINWGPPVTSSNALSAERL